MAGNGKRSGSGGDGKGGQNAAFGPSSGNGPKAGPVNLTTDPAGNVGDSRGRPNDFIRNPAGTGDKTGGRNLIANPAGDFPTPVQRSGSLANPRSIVRGPSGALPYSAPSGTPTAIDEPGAGRKPFKLLGTK